MNLRCKECKEPIIKDIDYQHWLCLMNYFEHQYLEEEITLATFEAMIDKLMTLKPDFED